MTELLTVVVLPVAGALFVARLVYAAALWRWRPRPTASGAWQYDLSPNRWTHPDTGVTVNDEDMPPELLPDPTERTTR